MTPCTDRADPRKLVARSYDRIATRYTQHALISRTDERDQYLKALFDSVPEGSRVLDLGCGSRIPMTARLAERFSVTGVDISKRQVELARGNVPSAAFIRADMATVGFTLSSFDAVFASYALIHVPRDRQPSLLQSIRGWTRPGGVLVATMATKATDASYERDWLGAPMYWSGFDTADNIQLVREAGFRIISAVEETAEEVEAGWVPITFLWVVAEAPRER